jgi:propanediol dehydratase small subunit
LGIPDFYTVSSVAEDVLRRYPLGARGDAVRTPGGLRLDELALDDARVTPEELRATPETLRLQADVAAASGRAPLAANLRRAAELAAVPQEVVLEIYTALRPGRSTREELDAWARRLEADGAVLTAAFVREASTVYAARGLLA